MKLLVKIEDGTPGHAVGQTYLHRGRALNVIFVRSFFLVGCEYCYEELEFEDELEAS